MPASRSSCVLALVLATAALAVETPSVDEFSVRVIRGRAWVLTADEEPATLHPVNGSAVFAAPLRVELRIGSEVVLSRPGEWSLRLAGPGIVSLEPSPVVEGRDPLPPVLTILDLGRAELEVRSERLRVRAEGYGWELAAGRAAFRLEERPGGLLRLQHHGGERIRLKSLSRRRPGTWPASVGPGRADLPPPQSEADSPSP